jgi:hypothetical protein
MLDTWHQLSPQEQQALRQDQQRCGEILRAKQQGKSSRRAGEIAARHSVDKIVLLEPICHKILLYHRATGGRFFLQSYTIKSS